MPQAQVLLVKVAVAIDEREGSPYLPDQRVQAFSQPVAPHQQVGRTGSHGVCRQVHIAAFGDRDDGNRGVEDANGAHQLGRGGATIPFWIRHHADVDRRRLQQPPLDVARIAHDFQAHARVNDSRERRA